MRYYPNKERCLGDDVRLAARSLAREGEKKAYVEPDVAKFGVGRGAGLNMFD